MADGKITIKYERIVGASCTIIMVRDVNNVYWFERPDLARFTDDDIFMVLSTAAGIDNVDCRIVALDDRLQAASDFFKCMT